MRVVVVESPAKAKTINKYLGDDFKVLASFGHVRDLEAKDGAVDPEHDFAMKWEVGPKSEKHVREIAEAVRNADALYLATDPDREGEAISWHVRDVLAKRKVLGGKPVHRITFNAITKTAVTNAMAAPRDLHQELIEAYLARRALDYLVGFNLSPVLWRKLPGSRSAGRVQSVALRLICEREAEIERFRAREYWTVEALMATTDQDGGRGGGQPFTARLTHLDGQKLDKFGLPDEAAAKAAVAAIEGTGFTVGKVERKTTKRNPAPPFTTSTLQQEASRKLYFSASRTMSVAQRLYEGITLGGETVGLITYMRTDGVQMAPEAIQATRAAVERDFGGRYLPDNPRMYKTKAKNAQEAHEAIRPTDPGRTPAMVAPYVSKEQLALYELIWKRTIASQMASAELDQVAVDLTAANGAAVLRATGSVITFDGFLKVYAESRDDAAEGDDDSSRILPPLHEGDAVERREVKAEQHFTQPPPRYSEASLVKKMEELGIGRPSTYASILHVLQERDYVRLESRRFVPEDRGRVVTAFLENFFARYVEYSFTAELENKLDEISAGALGYQTVLRDFWADFKAAVDQIQGLRVSEVLDALDAELEPHLFPPPEEGDDAKDPRACPSCGDGRLGLRLGKFGAFIGCSNYPECRFTRQLVATADDDGGAEDLAAGPRLLGTDPETGKAVTLRKGPYGLYVQLGEQEQIGETKTGKPKMGPKPPRASLPKGLDADRVDLQVALGLLALPRDVGPHPDDGAMIQAGLGRFGPYLKHGDAYKSLPKDDDPLLVLTIGLNRAVDLLAQQGGGRVRMAARALGDHPQDGKPVVLKDGRFGPYVEHGKARASLLKADRENIESLTLERALELIQRKAEKDAAKTQGGDAAPAGKSPGAGKAGAAKASTGTTKRKTAASASKTTKTATKPKATKATKASSSASGTASKTTRSRKSEPAG
ncbi:type I DNA topoisomerase [Roseospira navarrensis]|uniref:DNA topoisomerase 1 n=1 Tax=Roseospira navarrensis TaxID=140058 RepID=A0A7X1ZBK8_9PROT|nr:type I DNA topoisomerase [Roseospira navarrensis]MQX35555.1 type I DNA topoisomerase [Roseospira navarrensis]